MSAPTPTRANAADYQFTLQGCYHRTMSAHDFARHPSYKASHANKTQDLGNGYVIERRLVGYAYGDTATTSTPRYHWVLRLDGALVDSGPRRGPLVADARADLYRVSA